MGHGRQEPPERHRISHHVDTATLRPLVGRTGSVRMRPVVVFHAPLGNEQLRTPPPLQAKEIPATRLDFPFG